MKSPLTVKLEGWIAFLIPFLSAVGGSSLLTDTAWGKYIALICLALVGGLSGLKSFLSTTFSDSLPDSPVENQVAIPAVQPPPSQPEKPQPPVAPAEPK